LYVTLCRLLELVVLIARGDRAKELEILVPRHELSILRRHVSRPRVQPQDRLLLAAFSRVLPRRCWNAFFVQPETRSLQSEPVRLLQGASTLLARFPLPPRVFPPPDTQRA
jgi:hypothetical protein